MKRFHIPAIERLGPKLIDKRLKARGYENVDRALRSWLQRRKVPDAVKIMLLEIADENGVVLPMDELSVVPRIRRDQADAA